MKIGRITVSDRASSRVYKDRGGPEIERVLRDAFGPHVQFVGAIVPDEIPDIAELLIEFTEREHCDLIVTTGGTGIATRDVTPEATRTVLQKELPGFGEIMRAQSFIHTRTAILSRATAGTRASTLIVNLPGNPSAIAQCLALLTDAIREAIAHLHGEDPHPHSATSTPI
jgi:molybdopterin adenylyltransferase